MVTLEATSYDYVIVCSRQKTVVIVEWTASRKRECSTSRRQMDGLHKFLLLDDNVLRGLAIEKTESTSNCWVRESYSNRPTEGETNIHFPNLKEDRNKFLDIFQLFQQHSITYRKKKNYPRLNKQSNFSNCLTPTEKLVVKLR